MQLQKFGKFLHDLFILQMKLNQHTSAKYFELLKQSHMSRTPTIMIRFFLLSRNVGAGILGNEMKVCRTAQPMNDI